MNRERREEDMNREGRGGGHEQGGEGRRTCTGRGGDEDMNREGEEDMNRERRKIWIDKDSLL